MNNKTETALAVKSEVIPFSDMERMAASIAKSGLFGIKSADQAIALMLVAQSEGRHPASVASEFDIIQGRPALKAQAALSRFQQSGGRIQWLTRNDNEATIEGTHPAGGTLRVTWTMERAHAAGLTGKATWRQYPCALLSARASAEMVRALFPACLSGQYLVEEVQDFDTKPRRNVPELPEGTYEMVESKPLPLPLPEKKPDFTYDELPTTYLEELNTLMERDGVSEEMVMSFFNKKGCNPSNAEYLPEIQEKYLKGLVLKWDSVMGNDQQEAA
jgi:hypothetical protein